MTGEVQGDKGSSGMKRNRSESEFEGLGIPGAYDPVIELMLLEWEVETLRLPEPVEPGTGTQHAPEASVAGVGKTAGDRMSGESDRAVAAAMSNRGMCRLPRSFEMTTGENRWEKERRVV